MKMNKRYTIEELTEWDRQVNELSDLRIRFEDEWKKTPDGLEAEKCYAARCEIEKRIQSQSDDLSSTLEEEIRSNARFNKDEGPFEARNRIYAKYALTPEGAEYFKSKKESDNLHARRMDLYFKMMNANIQNERYAELVRMTSKDWTNKHNQFQERVVKN